LNDVSKHKHKRLIEKMKSKRQATRDPLVPGGGDDDGTGTTGDDDGTTTPDGDSGSSSSVSLGRPSSDQSSTSISSSEYIRCYLLFLSFSPCPSVLYAPMLAHTRERFYRGQNSIQDALYTTAEMLEEVQTLSHNMLIIIMLFSPSSHAIPQFSHITLNTQYSFSAEHIYHTYIHLRSYYIPNNNLNTLIIYC
jgi:hypothetical protein